MIEIILALALASGPADTASREWRPAGCTPEDRLTVDQVRVAETEAERGNITASVSLECHYLAIGEPDKAISWLRQSAAREPLTGQRYVNYLLQVGGKESCDEAYEL